MTKEELDQMVYAIAVHRLYERGRMAAVTELLQQEQNMIARIEGKGKDAKLVIEIPLETPKPSSSGKNLVVASSHGNQTTTAEVNGKQIVIGLNAYIKVG